MCMFEQSEQKVRYDVKSQGKPFSFVDMVCITLRCHEESLANSIARGLGHSGLLPSFHLSFATCSFSALTTSRFNWLEACFHQIQFFRAKVPGTLPPVGAGLSDRHSTPVVAMDEELWPNWLVNHVENAVALPTEALPQRLLPFYPLLLRPHLTLQLCLL